MSDEEALRAYMQETYMGLRDDRSTASYALEFLKTADSNLKLRHLQEMAESSFVAAQAKLREAEEWCREARIRVGKLALFVDSKEG